MHHTKKRQRMEEDMVVRCTTPPEMALRLFASCLFEMLHFTLQGSGGQLCIPLSAFLSLSDLLSDSEALCFPVNVSFMYLLTSLWKVSQGIARTVPQDTMSSRARQTACVLLLNSRGQD